VVHLAYLVCSIRGARVTEVIGAIRDKWLALGGEKGFGAALDIERPTFDGAGRVPADN
jgi:hypothetical protein